MKAIWKGNVIAEAAEEELIFIEDVWYFPQERVDLEFLRASKTRSRSSWKGMCQYFDVGEEGRWAKDAAFSYPDPPGEAIARAAQDFAGYIAFRKDIEIAD